MSNERDLIGLITADGVYDGDSTECEEHVLSKDCSCKPTVEDYSKSKEENNVK